MPKPISKLLLLLRTVRHLKTVQIVSRLKNAVHKPAVREMPGLDARALSQKPINLNKPDSLNLSKEFGQPVFTFLGVEKMWPNSVDWEDLSMDRLWRYNHHYFDFLNGSLVLDLTNSKRDLGAFLIDDWIDKNPPPTGTAWEPYPLSLRIVNWIKWSNAGGVFTREMHDSLAKQAGRLEQTLEYHILANHLFANAKAMVYAGCFFKGPTAERWLLTGLELVNSQLQEQILDDGGHYERSPMYHHIILEDVLDLIGLANAYGSTVNQPITQDIGTQWKDAALKMFGWANTMTHPDGDIAFFNDAAFAVAPSVGRLASYAKLLGLNVPKKELSSKQLPDTGYVRMNKGQATVLMSVAQVGPDYQPGHTHADALSLEFSVGKERVLVNSGTSTYNVNGLRAFQRSTAAHNTVTVDSRNSSEVWSGFRVARRGRVTDIRVDLADDGDRVSAKHVGYRRHDKEIGHYREVSLNHQELIVVDRIEGKFTTAVAHFYLHPGLHVDGQLLLTETGRRINWQVAGGKAVLEPSSWYPEFGQKIKNLCLRVEISSPECRVSFQF